MLYIFVQYIDTLSESEKPYSLSCNQIEKIRFTVERVHLLSVLVPLSSSLALAIAGEFGLNASLGTIQITCLKA